MKMIETPSVIVVVNPAELKPHPKNDYFFPAVNAEEEEQFVASVRERGIINMPVITSDGVIISGHRRVMAAVSCGFQQIQCQQRTYDNDDMVIYDLLASNIMSRGGVGSLFNSSPVKGARVVKEFARLFGNANDKSGTAESPIGMKLSVAQMSEELGMSRSTMGRAIQISKVEEDVAAELDGKVAVGALESVGKLLNPIQQRMLIELLPDGYENFTMQQFQVAVNELNQRGDEIEALHEDIEALEERLEKMVRKTSRLEEMTNPNCNLDEEIRARQELEVANAKYKAKIAEMQIKLAHAEKAGGEIETLRAQIAELEEEIANTEQQTVEVPVEVVPDDYEQLKDEVEELRASNESLSRQVAELREMDELARFAMGNIQTMNEMACNIESEELAEQLAIVRQEMEKLVTCVGKLKKNA